jgi:hypothetical protein
MAIQCKGEIVVSLMHNMGYLFIFSLILYECGPGEAAHTIAYNMKRCLRFSTFISLIYCQIWLNILLDHCPLSNIMKLKKEKEKILPLSGHINTQKS